MHLNNPKSSAAQGQERPTRSQISHIYTTEISQKALLRLPNSVRPDLCSCNSSKALQICRYPHPFNAGQRPNNGNSHQPRQREFASKLALATDRMWRIGQCCLLDSNKYRDCAVAPAAFIVGCNLDGSYRSPPVDLALRSGARRTAARFRDSPVGRRLAGACSPGHQGRCQVPGCDMA
jgi:hypothetical protein